MRRGKRARIILVWVSALALIMGAFFLLPEKASAATYVVTFDGTGLSYTVLQGSVVSSGTWISAYDGQFIKAGPANPAELKFDITGLWNTTITNYQATFQRNPGSSSIPINNGHMDVFFYDSSDTLLATEGRVIIGGNMAWQTYNWNTNVANVARIQVFWYNFGWFSGNIEIGLDNFQITTSTEAPEATVTPTTTPTETATPGGLPPLGYPYPSCPILGNDAARFANGFPTWYTEGTAYQYDQQNAISVYIPSTNAVYRALLLSPDKQYKIDIRFRSRSPSAEETFTVTLGKTTLTIPIPQDPDYPDLYKSSWESPPANFQPSSEGSWYFEIRRPNGISVDLIIDYACVSEVLASSTPIAAPNQPTSADSGCRACTDPTSILDIGGIINWVLCQVLRFFECFIGFLIQQIVLFIISFIALIITIFKFFYDLVGGVISFATDSGGTISRFAAGFGQNVGTGMVNAFQQSGAADAFNHVSRGIQDMPTLFGNFFTDAASTLTTAFQTGASIFDVIGGLIAVAIKVIGFIIGLIPLIFQSLIEGFNTSSQTMAGALSCADPGDLWFYPCMGFYILDNTVFQGPALYIVPAIVGLWSFETLLWVIEKVRAAFASG